MDKTNDKHEEGDTVLYDTASYTQRLYKISVILIVNISENL